MLPTIALVGRPNVGKSTLFNRLTRSRAAIVSDFSGLTRDRQYGQGVVGDAPYLVVDTGGLGDAQHEIDNLAIKQTLLAAEEADAILLLVDARAGLTANDKIIAAQLRKLNKPIYLVVNKIDGLNRETALADFYGLGFDTTCAISAEHGDGVETCITEILHALTPTADNMLGAVTDEHAENAVKIAIIGRPNVGKSTLVNRILGEERVVVYDEPGTTRDSIFINLQRHGKDYVLIDTAGVRRKSKIDDGIERVSVVKTLQAISAANVVVLLLDARENIAEQDLKLIGFALESGKALVIAVNKWDNIPIAQRDRVRDELDRRLTFVNFADIYFISALHGTGVGNLFKSIDKAYRSATREIKTGEINRVLENAVHANPPPLVHGRNVKLLYAHAGGHNPPLFIIHGTRTNSIPAHYVKYLENYFRKALRLSGTPIKIVFKEKERG